MKSYLIIVLGFFLISGLNGASEEKNNLDSDSDSSFDWSESVKPPQSLEQKLEVKLKEIADEAYLLAMANRPYLEQMVQQKANSLVDIDGPFFECQRQRFEAELGDLREKMSEAVLEGIGAFLAHNGPRAAAAAITINKLRYFIDQITYRLSLLQLERPILERTRNVWSTSEASRYPRLYALPGQLKSSVLKPI